MNKLAGASVTVAQSTSLQWARGLGFKSRLHQATVYISKNKLAREEQDKNDHLNESQAIWFKTNLQGFPTTTHQTYIPITSVVF